MNLTSDRPDIDWAARKKRAEAHLELLRAEWERARGKKTTPRWIPYEYQDAALLVVAAPHANGGEGQIKA